MGAGPRWARRPFGPRPFPPPDDATASAPQRPRQSLRTRAPAPVAAPGSAAPKVAERAGGGTSLKGLRERMGERAGGSRGFSGPCGTRDSRGFGDRRSGRTRLRSRLARRRVLLSPPSERPGTGRVAERDRGREGRPAQVLQPRGPTATADGRTPSGGRGPRELTGATGAGGRAPGPREPEDNPEPRLPLGGGGQSWRFP